MLRLGGACAAAVLIALGTPAHADVSVDTARAAIEASDYLTARSQLIAIQGAGTSGPEDLAELHKLTGIVAGALGETQIATVAFQMCLALTPKARLPVGTSPKIAGPFAAAQAYFQSRAPLQIKAETSATPPSVSVVVVSDPMSMIARARVTLSVDGGSEQTLEGTGTGKITIALPEGKRLDLRIAALDTMGNRVAEIGSADVPIVIVDGKAAKVADPVVKDARVTGTAVIPGPDVVRPTYLQWWLWGGATAVFAGAGTVFGLAAMSAKNDLERLNATSPSHTFDEARAKESTTRTRVLLTNIGYGAAAVCGVTTVILYLTRPRTYAERRSAVIPVPVHGGAGLAVEGRF